MIEYINRTLEKETEAKQHQTLLKNELHHRINNLFAVIQSVIRFSLPNNDAPVSPALFKDRLLVRLQAMLDANQYVGDSEGEVALFDLVRGQIRGLDNQVRIHGRPHLMLNPQLTQNFSLILYELVTNSLKYGPLSTARGRVHIELLESQAGVVFDWTELHGPMVSAPPDDGSGDGFGSRILGPFARGFCSDVRIAYDPRGFRYALRIPLQGRPQAARSAATEGIRAEVI
jgi:two-component sensor histidine kinase